MSPSREATPLITPCFHYSMGGPIKGELYDEMVGHGGEKEVATLYDHQVKPLYTVVMNILKMCTNVHVCDLFMMIIQFLQKFGL